MIGGAVLLIGAVEGQKQSAALDAYIYEEMASKVRAPDEQASIVALDVAAASPTAGIATTQPAASIEPTSTGEFSAMLPVYSDAATLTVDLTVLQQQNKDIVAWLRIPGTVIDYPVVRSDNSDYYLHHLFTGQSSKLGCLFSLTTSDYEKPSRNIAIYGHHLSTSDAMFSGLVKYKEADYYHEHPLIQLSSLYGEHEYRIFAVLNQKVTDWDASTSEFSDDSAFHAYIEKVKRLSLYDTGVDVSAEDHILTLITCDRSFGGLRGRLLILAVEI